MFLYDNFNENSIRSKQEKNWQKSVATLLASEINSTGVDITGPTAHVRIMFSWKDGKRMVSFPGYRWISKQSKKVKLYKALHRNIIELFVAHSDSQKSPKYHICQHCGMKTSKVTLSFYYVSNIFLDCNDSIPSFIVNIWRVLFLGNHLDGTTKLVMALYFTSTYISF